MKKARIFVIIMIVYIVVTLFFVTILPGIISPIIVLEGNVRWQYKNHEWIDFESSKVLTGYKVYDSSTGKSVGTYDMKYDGKKWLLKVNNRYKSYDKSMLAFKAPRAKVYSFNIEFPENKTDINKIVSKAGIKNNPELTILYKVDIDINGDGSTDTLYGISNMDDLVENQFFILGMCVDNECSIIKKNTGKVVPSISIYAIIDIDGDSNLELILEDSGYSMTSSQYSLYSLVDGEYEMMISTGGSL